ncbi:MAG: hypothetical protein R3C59_04645 [Planctomycetaceae bacterium]
MVNEDELRSKRVYVGLLAIAGLAGGAVLTFFPGNEGVQAACIRIGLVLGAFWLAMPTANRPAAWKKLSSNWMIFALIITAIVIPRAKAMFPVLAILAGVAWFARPRK